MVVLLMAGFTACTGDDDLFEDSFAELLDDVSGGGNFQWTRSEDMETHQEFLRNFGVGYSYNAVRGSYCEWQDIRCQVLNRAMLLDMQNTTGDDILRTDQTQFESLKSSFQYSFRDYVVNMDIDSKEEIDLGLYNSSKRKKQHFIEDGVQESYYYTLSEKLILAHQFVGWANVQALYPQKREMLTESFRNAVLHLVDEEDYNVASVDSFVNVWGTHVIVEAWLGGAIHVDLMNNMWRWTALSKDSAWTTKEFLGIVADTENRRKTSNEYRWTEHSRLDILARGGDQQSLTGLLGKHRYDGTREFSTEGINVWRSSLNYDPDDERGSNVELVDMKVLPIWDFAALISPRAAFRLKANITQDAALQQQLLGDKNFFAASFPIRYGSATCQWRKDTGTWQQATRSDSNAEPMMVNIMSGGRYVAIVCHETIDNKSMWVCYPIYEGRLKLACGIGVDDGGNVYSVRWIGGVVNVLSLDKITESPNFYINEGAVGVDPMESVTYPDYQALPYIELSGGVKPDGSYAATAYSVKKEGEDFLLLAPAGLTDIVGFTDTGESSGDYHIYKRNDNYVYIYNQNEIK